MADLDPSVKNILSSALNDKLNTVTQYQTNFDKREREFESAKVAYERAKRNLESLQKDIVALQEVVNG